jgi:hypothetical protein
VLLDAALTLVDVESLDDALELLDDEVDVICSRVARRLCRSVVSELSELLELEELLDESEDAASEW